MIFVNGNLGMEILPTDRLADAAKAVNS